jgi:hypothetical protein
MDHIDRPLWEHMKALSAERISPVLGDWVGSDEIKAIIERRDRMKSEVEKLVASKGEARTFIQ